MMERTTTGGVTNRTGVVRIDPKTARVTATITLGDKPGEHGGMDEIWTDIPKPQARQPCTLRR